MTKEELKERLRHDLTTHPPSNSVVSDRLDDATATFIAIGEWIIDKTAASREQSLALTKLEELSMWTKAAIARHQ